MKQFQFNRKVHGIHIFKIDTELYFTDKDNVHCKHGKGSHKSWVFSEFYHQNEKDIHTKVKIDEKKLTLLVKEHLKT